MGAKRPSPVDDSPRDAHRHKRLPTRFENELQHSIDKVDTTATRRSHYECQTSSTNGQVSPTTAVASMSTSELPILAFHDQFCMLDITNERSMTPAKHDVLGATWRVIWQPRSPTDPTFVGLFVELVAYQENALPRLAELSFVLMNQGGHAPLVKHTSVHAFSKESPEFGISQFIQRSDLLNPSKRFLTKEGKVEIEVQLSFIQDVADVEEMKKDEAMTLHSTSVMRQDAVLTNGSQLMLQKTQHVRLPYDSMKETGMVGLKNQGATCYLNSLLQTLFHLRAFRQVVYETPTAQEDTNNSVTLALQRVFYRLQRQRKAVSTKELTRSFGWSTLDSFMQHDVQELYRILCDRLEEKMKHTRVDTAIPKLFEGKVRSFVQCVNVDFQSFRDESFYDLQLDVKGCKDIMQSFRKYVEVEMLDGDNQYEAEGHGKQDAKKGIEFATFPPVLNIQLKRFEYDATRDGMVKIHDRFEFSKRLVLDEFIADNGKKNCENSSKTSPRYVYHLHSVLVHSGDVHGGHYYVFIRPGKHIATNVDWFKFDDEQIMRVDEQIAIEGNFGSAWTPVTPQDRSSEPLSPLYSSSLFCSPDRNGGKSNERNSMNGLEFRSVDTRSGRATDGDDATDEMYDNSQSNTAALGPAPDSLMLPLGRSFSSAYMLVYVRDGENDISAIQDEASTPVASATINVTKNALMADDEAKKDRVEVAPAAPVLPTWQSDPLPIPTDLITRFQEEEKAVVRRKKAQQTEHLYMNFRIASDTSIVKLKRITKTMDFSGFNNSATLRIRIKRAASIRQLYQRVYNETGVPVSRQRLWKVITRENRTTRPDQSLDPDLYEFRVDSLIEDDASTKSPVKLYLQILNSLSECSATSSPSLLLSPSMDACEVGSLSKRPAAVIHRHFWDEFTPPENEDDPLIATDMRSGQEIVERNENGGTACGNATDSILLNYAPPLQSHEILLFIKFYNVKKQLGERLEYMGNIVVTSRITGAELATYLHEALSIPLATELLLYEEIQPLSVSEIDMERTLFELDIQNGDIICFQYAEDEAIANGIVVDPDLKVNDGPDVAESACIGPDGDGAMTVISPDSINLMDVSVPANSSATYVDGNRGLHRHGSTETGQISTEKHHQYQQRLAERYPDVPSYFQYLLDRVEVTFRRYGYSREESFTLTLLFSNVYDEVIDAVAEYLGLLGPKRLFVRLYQHSPLNSLPMKSPLRHARYAGDDQTTLEELLTEYLERTNILYYELLNYPITEIEAKKELFVHLSIYDACFATEQTASPSPIAPERHIEVLVLPTHQVRDLLQLTRDGFDLPESIPLRACEVVQHGSMIKRVIKEEASLSRYWSNGIVSDANVAEILVEQIPAYEMISDNKSAMAALTAFVPEAPGVSNVDRVASNKKLSPESRPTKIALLGDQEDATPDDDNATRWYYKGVVHFNFVNNSQNWIHPHGVPCIIRFSKRDTIGDIKERIRQRMGTSADVFDQWNFAFVKDLKASTLQNIYDDDVEPKVVDTFSMSRLTKIYGADYEGFDSFGLEHADPTPAPRYHSNRRLETGIHIRQS